ncbi:TspO/MBR family protein [Lacticaseibacillus saniviri]
MIAKRKINWLHLFIFVVVVEMIGILSGVLAGDIKTHYLALNLPIFSPPAAVFGPVWTILYLMIGISGYLVLNDSASRATTRTNFWLFVSQLILNFCWSIVFFGGNQYFIGLIIIILLDAVVIMCIRSFKPVNRVAAYLLVPYLLWLLFATYLTLGVALLN